MQPEALYAQFAALLAEMPDLARDGPYPPEVARWLGRAAALVREVDPLEAYKFQLYANQLHSMGREAAAYRMLVLLHECFARVELQAPPGLAGAYIAVGASFDAVAALNRVFRDVQRDVFLVDPYAEASAVTDVVALVPGGVSVRLMADSGTRKPSLRPAVESYAKQYGPERPLEVRLSPEGRLHDRIIAVDGTAVFTIGQSFNHLARRAPTVIARLDQETGALKLQAYEAIWREANQIT